MDTEASNRDQQQTEEFTSGIQPASLEIAVAPIQQAIDHINTQYYAMCKMCGKEPSTTIQLSSIDSDYKALSATHPDLSFSQYIEYLSESKSWSVKPNFQNVPENASQKDLKSAFDANQDMCLKYDLVSLLTYSERKGKFIEAINAYKPKTIDFAYTNDDKIRLQQEIKETGLLLVGEIHGVVQNCDILYTMCKSLGIRRLAIEFPCNYQASVDEFLNSGKLDFGQIEHYPDGRINAELYALMKKMKDEGLLDQVICMDQEDSLFLQSEASRDQSMFENLTIQKNISEPILAIAGSYHTIPRDTRVDDSDHSLGFLVQQNISTAPIATIRYQAGQYHNYGPQAISGAAKEASSSPMWGYTRTGLQIVIPHADLANVPNPNEKISQPT